MHSQSKMDGRPLCWPIFHSDSIRLKWTCVGCNPFWKNKTTYWSEIKTIIIHRFPISFFTAGQLGYCRMTENVKSAQKHDGKSFSGLKYGQKATVKIWCNLEHCRGSLWKYLILAWNPIGNGLAGQSAGTCRHASKMKVTQDQVQVVMMKNVLRLCWKVEWLGSESSCNIGPEIMAWFHTRCTYYRWVQLRYY